VDERESLRVESQTTDRVGLCIVFAVACNRVAYPLLMNADLILPACFQLELHLGVWHAIDLSML
jgi:hypothetical protein